MVAGEDVQAVLRGHHAIVHQRFANLHVGCALNGGYVFKAAFGALEHHKPLGRVFAHAIGARAFAIEQLCLALGGGGIGQRLKDGLAQRGKQGGGGFVNLVTVGLQWRGGVGLRAGVAVLQAVAPGLGGLCNGEPLQKQRVRLRLAVGEGDDLRCAVRK